MTGRTTRSAISSQDALEQLSPRERLLFAQVIYELGSERWAEVSKLLAQHPLIDRPKGFFGPQSCQGIYLTMMKEVGIEVKDDTLEEVKKPKARPNLVLAQTYYKERIAEIKEAILDEETKFKTIAQEIKDIQDGKWDDRLASELQEALSKSRKTKPPPSPTTRKTRLTKSIAAEVPTPPEPVPSTSEPVPEPVSLEDESKDEPLTAPQPKTPEAIQIDEDEPTAVSENLESMIEDEAEETREPLPSPDVERADATTSGEIPSRAPTPTEPAEDETSKATTRRASTRRGTITRAGAPSMYQPRGLSGLIIPPGKVKSVDSVSETPKDRKRTREVSESLKEEEEVSTPAIKKAKFGNQQANKRFQSGIMLVHQAIGAQRNGGIFRDPIKASEAPDYANIVKRPMDLKTIRTKVKDGVIQNTSDFERDVYLMYANAIMYNLPTSDIYKMGEEMMVESEALIQSHRQTEGFHVR